MICTSAAVNNELLDTCTVLHCTLLHCTVLHYTVLHCTALYCTAWYCTVLHYSALYRTVLCLYLDKRRGVQKNTSMRSREFPWVKPEGTPSAESWYFPVLPDLSQCTDITQFLMLVLLLILLLLELLLELNWY